MFIVTPVIGTYATIEAAEAAAREYSASGAVAFVAEIVGKISATRAEPVYSVKDATDKPASSMAEALASKLAK
jgi:hypothetical protein